MVDQLQVHVVVGEPADDHTVEARRSGSGALVAHKHPLTLLHEEAVAPSFAVEEGRRLHQLPISVRTV